MLNGGKRMRKTLSQGDFYEHRRDGMQSAHCWRGDNNHCMAHFHSSIELLYVEDGEITANLDGQSYQVKKGELLLASSYSVHTYRTEEGKSNRVVIMIIPLTSVPSLQKTLNKRAFSQVIYDAREDYELQTLLSMIPANWTKYENETRKGFSYAILGLLISRVGLKDQPSNQQCGLMRDVLIYLQENYQQPLHMESLAKHFGYSKSRFSRLFHDHLGCSMIEYLAVLRCRQAAHLLLESEMTMLDIAMNVGFECLRTFYRAFKNCYDMTPTQYIKENTRE